MLLTLLALFAASQDFKAKIIFYPSDTIISHDLMQAEKIFENPKFIASRPTVFYFHGFNSNPDKDSTISIVKAYTKANSFNILILDWSTLASAIYSYTVLNLEKLATEIVKFMLKMTIKGYVINMWHIVGHSLGAQLAGIVGRKIISLSNSTLTLSRITALDPAGPGFYNVTLGPKPINKYDAKFVDVIHTDAGMLGAPVNTGTVDFWPNNGRRSQPGCWFFNEIVGCSHGRSIDFWSESVENIGKVLFTSENEFDPTIKAQMGIYCSTNLQPGSYRLKTNSKTPYSNG